MILIELGSVFPPLQMIQTSKEVRFLLTSPQCTLFLSSFLSQGWCNSVYSEMKVEVLIRWYMLWSEQENCGQE